VSGGAHASVVEVCALTVAAAVKLCPTINAESIVKESPTPASNLIHCADALVVRHARERCACTAFVAG
jgi:hypothetical protein